MEFRFEGVGGDAEGDSFGPDCERIIGSDHDDSLTGRGQPVTYYGRDGDDTLKGSSGDDTLYGGPGNDTLEGSSGYDTLYGGPGNDILQSNGIDDAATFTYKLYGGPGDDTLIVVSDTDRSPTEPSIFEFYFRMGFGRDTVENFDIANDTIYLCGMEGVDWTGWPGSEGYRISVRAYETLPYVGRVKWFQGSIMLEGVTLPWSKNQPAGGLNIIVSESCDP